MAAKQANHEVGSSAEHTEGLAKVTLLLGQDTVDRLDRIVRRGHFGGRGRALDALLDSLEDCVEDLEYWDLAFRHYSERRAPPEQVRMGQNDMIAHVDRVRTKLERFFSFADWDSPKLPWEEELARERVGGRRKRATERSRSPEESSTGRTSGKSTPKSKERDDPSTTST